MERDPGAASVVTAIDAARDMPSSALAAAPGPASDTTPGTVFEAPLSTIAHVGFLMLPNYSMIAFSSAVEVLRMANYVGRAEHYRWSIYTADGAPVRASNGLTVKPTRQLDCDIRNVERCDLPDVLLVCAGWHVREYVDAQVIALLRDFDARGLPLGGICTGAYALLAAGLLDGFQCTIHWEDMSPLHADYPDVHFADALFVIDRKRLTCTGGTAPLDLMLNLVAMRLGRTHAAQVSEQFIVERIRGSGDFQPIPVDARVGLTRQELVEVVRLMEANIEEPLSLDELARLVSLSQRHLQRMFKAFLNVTPTHYYLSLRLRRARELLRNSDASVARITARCGFHSPAHFSKAYRAQFGHAPSSERHGGGQD